MMRSGIKHNFHKPNPFITTIFKFWKLKELMMANIYSVFKNFVKIDVAKVNK